MCRAGQVGGYFHLPETNFDMPQATINVMAWIIIIIIVIYIAPSTWFALWCFTVKTYSGWHSASTLSHNTIAYILLMTYQVFKIVFVLLAWKESQLNLTTALKSDELLMDCCFWDAFLWDSRNILMSGTTNKNPWCRVKPHHTIL